MKWKFFFEIWHFDFTGILDLSTFGNEYMKINSIIYYFTSKKWIIWKVGNYCVSCKKLIDYSLILFSIFILLKNSRYGPENYLKYLWDTSISMFKKHQSKFDTINCSKNTPTDIYHVLSRDLWKHSTCNTTFQYTLSLFYN